MIPEEILEKVNEHTGGGFMIFYIDQNGEPDFIPFVDSSVQERGLVSYIEDTVEAIRMSEKSGMMNGFVELFNEEDDDDEEDKDNFGK